MAGARGGPLSRAAAGDSRSAGLPAVAGITVAEFVTSFRVGYVDGTLVEKPSAEGHRGLRRVGVLILRCKLKRAMMVQWFTQLMVVNIAFAACRR